MSCRPVVWTALCVILLLEGMVMSAHAAPLRPGPNPVQLQSRGETIKGTLHLPADYRSGQTLPLVVVAGSWTTVKEQMPDAYARRLAGEGFAALTFDFRHWGQSGGLPRHYEHPERKIEDIAAVAAWARRLPLTRGRKVGGLGICASAGYMAAAIARSAPSGAILDAFVAVAPWFHDAATVPLVYGGEEGVAARLRASREAEAAMARGEPVPVVPACSVEDPQAAMHGPFDYYLNPARGAVPAWSNRFAVQSWEPWLTFDALAAAPSLRVPALLLHSDQAALPDNVRRFAQAMPAPPRTVWVDGQHLDFYDDPVLVSTCVAAMAAHFRTHLGEAGTPEQQRRSRSVAGSLEFLAALEAMDLPRFLALWREDGVQAMPFAPEGMARELAGRDAVAAQYAGVATHFASMRFPLKALWPTVDPDALFLEFRGDIRLKDGDRKYDNAYCNRFTFRDGKLARLVEYFDPLVFQKAFGTDRDAASRDQAAVTEAVNAVARLADLRDWDGLRQVLAETVTVDYASLTGVRDGPMPATALTARWEEAFARFESTLHVVDGHATILHGDEAVCDSRFMATHVLREPADATSRRWTLGGRYRHELRRVDGRWRVTAITMTMDWAQP